MSETENETSEGEESAPTEAAAAQDGDVEENSNADAAAEPGSDAEAGAKEDITDEEVDALLEKPSAAAGEAGLVVPFDLVARDKIVRERMPILDRINQQWGKDFQRALSELIRRPVDAEVESVELMRFGEWQASNSGLTCFNVYSVMPWQRNAMVASDGALLFALVDAYYGGKGSGERKLGQGLTPTETRLNAIIVGLMIDRFKTAFEPIASIDFVHQKSETNPHYAEIATSSETVVISRARIELGDIHGALSLVMPLSMFDSVRDRLTEALKSASKDEQRRWYRSLRGQLDRTDVELATVFLSTEISLRDLLELVPGDVMPIEMPKTATLFAGSRPLLNGKFGRSRGYNAVSVIGPTADAVVEGAQGGKQ